MGLDSQVQAEQSEPQREGRKLLEVVSLHPEGEGRSRSAVCPLGLSEMEKPQHTGQTSQCGCPDQRLHRSVVGSLFHWGPGRRVTPSAPLAAVPPTTQM